jgi:hypothetical protein
MFVSLAELLVERRALDAQEAAWLKKVAASDRSGDWSADGFLSPVRVVHSGEPRPNVHHDTGASSC